MFLFWRRVIPALVLAAWSTTAAGCTNTTQWAAKRKNYSSSGPAIAGTICAADVSDTPLLDSLIGGRAIIAFPRIS